MVKSNSIDIENASSLRNYLLSKDRITAKDNVVSQLLSGGVSNKTVLVHINENSFVMKQGLSKLRVPSDWYSNPARISREAMGMQALKIILPPEQITNLIFIDDQENILMMAAVPMPHENFKALLLKGGDQNSLIQKMAKMLASIHQTSWQNQELAKEFGNTDFFHELRIDPYFRFCVQKFPEYAPWFQKNIFDKLSIKNCLVHGDFSPKNILVYQKELVLLDHEVIHFGDCAFDFGFVFTHLFLKSVHLKSEAFLENSLAFAKTYFLEMKNYLTKEDQNRAMHYFLACLLARVAGKSKTDYLGSALEEKIKNTLAKIILKEEIPNLETVRQLFLITGKNEQN
jgi:5-methylthioribose kinase